MSFSDGTRHYGLPQFQPLDTPTWYGDINEAFHTIDEEMYQNSMNNSGVALREEVESIRNQLGENGSYPFGETVSENLMSLKTKDISQDQTIQNINNEIEGINHDIDYLTELTDEHTSQISILKSDIVNITKKVEDNHYDIANNQMEILTLSSENDNLNHRVTELEKNTGSNDTEWKGDVENVLADHNVKIETNSQGIITLSNRCNTLSQSIESAKVDITAIKEWKDGAQEEFTNVRQDIINVGERITVLDNKVKKLGVTYTNILAKVNPLTNDTQRLTGLLITGSSKTPNNIMHLPFCIISGGNQIFNSQTEILQFTRPTGYTGTLNAQGNCIVKKTDNTILMYPVEFMFDTTVHVFLGLSIGNIEMLQLNGFIDFLIEK